MSISRAKTDITNLGYSLDRANLWAYSEPARNAKNPAEPRDLSHSDQQAASTQEDIVTMIEAGFAKDTVIAVVRGHGPDFDTFQDVLVALRDAIVDDGVAFATTPQGGARTPLLNST